MSEAAGQLPLEFGGCGSAPEPSQAPRREPRLAAVRLVEFAPFPRARRTQRWHTGVTRDLSASGLCLRSQAGATVNSLLRVVVRDVDGRPALDSVARVAWTRATDDETWIGLELVATRARHAFRAVPALPRAAASSRSVA